MKRYISSQEIDNSLSDCIDITPILRKDGKIRSLFIHGKPNQVYYDNLELLDKIKKVTSFMVYDDFRARISCIQNNITCQPKCENCETPLKYSPDKQKGGFGRFCCYKCSTGVGKRSAGKNIECISNFIKDVESKYNCRILSTPEEQGDSKETNNIKFECKECNSVFYRKRSWIVNTRKKKCIGYCDCCIKKLKLYTSPITTPVIDICNILQIKGIEYFLEKMFDDCINPLTHSKLRFDIYIPSMNVVIEYDGPQHTIPIFGDEEFKNSLYRDNIKNKYCAERGIRMIRVPYTDPSPDATIVKELFSNIKFFYEWGEYRRDLYKLYSIIQPEDEIYAIYRGSLVPGVHLTNLLGDKELGIIQFQRYDGVDKSAKFLRKIKEVKGNIYIIDDVFETGHTMEKCIKLLKRTYKHNQIIPYTLFGMKNNLGVKYLREHPHNWIVFPWEIINDTRCKSCKYSEPCYKNPNTYIHCNIKDKSFPNNNTCKDFEKLCQ